MRFTGLVATLFLLYGLGVSANALADDLKVSQLEQDVRELKREVDQQTRRIETLERELSQSNTSLAPSSSRPKSSSSEASQGEWTHLANWNKIKVGMPELDVIQILGPPTTLRKSQDGNQQTLFYALEIGTGNFLTGSIKMIDHKVVDLQKPALK